MAEKPLGFEGGTDADHNPLLSIEHGSEELFGDSRLLPFLAEAGFGAVVALTAYKAFETILQRLKRQQNAK